MNQLATAEKRFPRSEQDIATDYAALRKHLAQSKRPKTRKEELGLPSF